MESRYLEFLQKVEDDKGTREEFLPIWKNFKEGLKKEEIRVAQKDEQGNFKVVE